jgi:uncharacterized membrane protein YgdD (TMEM256/DUF423 family)
MVPVEMNDNLDLRPRRLTAVSMPSFWNRAVWMRLGAVNGLLALSVLLSDQPRFISDQAADVRLGAQVQFMHGMASLASATFMNVGAKGARLAPAFFLGGILLYCVPIYASAVGLVADIAPLKVSRVTAFGLGWLILAWFAGEIDRD